MSEPTNGLSPEQLRAVKFLAGAASDGADVAGSDPETAAEFAGGDVPVGRQAWLGRSGRRSTSMNCCGSRFMLPRARSEQMQL